LLAIVALFIYLGTAWLVLPPQAMWSPDEGAKLLQLQYLRFEGGHLVYAIPYIGRDIDPEMRFAQPDTASGLLQIGEDALYFRRLPVFPLLELPFFWLSGFRGLYLLPAISGAACSILALHLVEKRDRRPAMGIVIALGSPVFIYSTIFWEHTIATSLGIFSAWLILKIWPMHSSKWGQALVWTVAGAMLGISAYLRLELILFSISLLVACWFVQPQFRQGLIWSGIIMLLILMPYIPLHMLMFNQPLPDNARYLFYPFLYLKQLKWRAVTDLLVGLGQDLAINLGWLGDLWAIASIVAVSHSLDPTKRAARNLMLAGLGTTAVIGAIYLFTDDIYRSAHGLFFSTPWALLGLCRAAEVWRRGDWRAKVIVLTILLGLTSHIACAAGFRSSGPHGGLEWGSRFALTFYPLLGLVAAWDLGSARDDAKTLLIAGALLFLGIGFQVRGVLTLQHDKQINAKLNQMLVEAPERYVVSDLWWIPFNAAPIYAQKAWCVTLTPTQLREWIDLAASHQVRQFVLVTLNNNLLNAIPTNGYVLHLIEEHQIEHLSILRISITP